GPIIISLEEITCCYLVKCKLVLATGYYYEIYNKTGTLPKNALTSNSFMNLDILHPPALSG
ncbi:MAG: hypothetical protein M0Q43_05525, partial [Methanothrix sp.]|nr:hypothetical protein [Methanothrix sp.]